MMLKCTWIVVMFEGRGGLRLLGASGWNLERGTISNDKEGWKRIYFGIGAPEWWGPLALTQSAPPLIRYCLRDNLFVCGMT